MKTISLDLRERILAAYDGGESTREEVGWRFRVSTGMVKKLLQQRRHIGEIGPRHYRSGRKTRIDIAYQRKLRDLLVGKPDMTLAEMRSALTIKCSLPAIHYVLVKMGLTYKKRRSGQASRIGRMWSKRGDDGFVSKGLGIPASWCSSMNRRPRRT